MRIFKRDNSARERKTLTPSVEDWPWTLAPPVELLESSVSVEQAAGLPAVQAALRLLANSCGQCPWIVYHEGDGGVRERATDSEQWSLFHDGRGLEATPFALKADLAASLAGHGAAALRKFRAPGGRVSDLVPLDVRKVRPRREGGVVVFEDSTEGRPITRGRDEIVYIRGYALNGGLRGVSPITSARMALSAALRRERFEAAYFANEARPGLVISFPAAVSEEQAKAWIEAWEMQHKGPRNANRVGVMGGGAQFTTLPVSLEDAAFVEATKLSVQQVASLFSIPPSLLGDRAHEATETDRLLYVQHAVGPLLTALDQAVSRDDDLFPRGSRLYVESLSDALLRSTTSERYEAYRRARQGGWITANELRKLENYPPLPGGDELQQTPVGGAPNRPRE